MADVRLIDANALAQRFSAMQECTNMRDHVYLMGVLSVIDNAPAIDAVPVVRCRNCRLWRRTEKHYGKCPFLIGENQFASEDGFCNLGEKMDGGATDGSDA